MNTYRDPIITTGVYPSGKPFWSVRQTLADGSRYQKKWPTEASAVTDRNERRAALRARWGNVDVAEYQLARHILASSDNVEAQQAGLVKVLEWGLKSYVDHSRAGLVERFCRELLELKRRQNRRACTILELDRVLTKFAHAFGTMPVSAVTLPELNSYVTATATGATSKRRLQAHIKHFFDYVCGTSRRSPNPVPVMRLAANPTQGWILDISHDQTEHESTQVLNSDEVQALLKEAAKFNAQRMFVWLLFTGMRPLEAVRFWTDPKCGWKLINLATRQILVPGRIAKTRRTRQVRIRPVLEQWLRKYESHESFCTKNWRDKYLAVRAILPEEKRSVADIARHTWISMLVPSGAPLAEIALEAGNTQDIQFKHYLALIRDEADHHAFWDLGPDKVQVFDQPEASMPAVIRQNRTKAILKNRLNVLHDRFGRTFPSESEVAALLCRVQGLSDARAAQETGWSVSTIYRWRRKALLGTNESASQCARYRKRPVRVEL